MNKKERIQLNLRLDGQGELLEAVKATAASQGKSITQFVIDALKVACGVVDEGVMPSSMTSPLPSDLVREQEFKAFQTEVLEKLKSMREEIEKLTDSTRIESLAATPIAKPISEPVGALEHLENGLPVEPVEDKEAPSQPTSHATSPHDRHEPSLKTSQDNSHNASPVTSQNDNQAASHKPSYQTSHNTSQNISATDQLLSAKEVQVRLGYKRPDQLTRLSDDDVKRSGFERVRIGKKSKYRQLPSSVPSKVVEELNTDIATPIAVP